MKNKKYDIKCFIACVNKLTGLTMPHFCACPKTGPGFPNVMVLFMFNDLK